MGGHRLAADKMSKYPNLVCVLAPLKLASFDLLKQKRHF
jgi:hypothetical protein